MAISVYPPKTPRTIDFTSSSTWTVPAGVYSAEFLVVGAGGGGGSRGNIATTARTGAQGGGGGGAVKKLTLPTTPGSIYTITIGAKGLGASTATSPGAAGGTSEIVLSGTSLIVCYGGQGSASRNENTTYEPTVSKTVAGGAGNWTSSATAVGGGGGSGSQALLLQESTVLYPSPLTASTTSVEGTTGKGSVTTTSSYANLNAVGTIGFEHYGHGGAGGWAVASAYSFAGATLYGAGAGGVAVGAGTKANGGNATMPGCGGGGAAMYQLTTTDFATGGNGADGLVRITYVG